MSFEIIKSVWNLFSDNWEIFLHGAWYALIIALVGTIFGVLIGLVIGIVHTIPLQKKSIKSIILKFINFILTFYVEVFRGTPMMVQAMVIFYGLVSIDIQLNRIIAGMIVVSLNTGAYMAEYVRGGILSIDKGQYEASQAIGMNHFQTMFYIILPQVARNIMPATGNQLVMNIKDSSVLSVISVVELFFTTNSIAGSTFKYFEAFLIASVLYFIMTFTVTRILLWFEKKMDGPDAYEMDLVEENKPVKEGK